MNYLNSTGRVLVTLFMQPPLNIDLVSLSHTAGLRPLTVLRALAALERAGLVDARKLRLTLPGLAVAAALKARCGACLHVSDSRRALLAA